MTRRTGSVEAAVSIAASEELETVYGRLDLLGAAVTGFGVQPEIMAGALRLAGLDDGATQAEARLAIDQFLKRQV